MCSKRFQCERSEPIGVDFKKSQGEDMCKAIILWKLTSLKIKILLFLFDDSVTIDRNLID